MNNGPSPVCGQGVNVCGGGARGVRMNSGRYGGLINTRLTFEDGTDSGTTLPNEGRHLFTKKKVAI